MAIIGNLVADLSANSAAFGRDMGAASRDLRSNTARMNRSLGALDRGFASIRASVAATARGVFSVRGAVAGLAAAGGLVYAGRQALSTADDMAKLADQTGFAVERVSALQYQASQTGALSSFESGLRTFAQTTGNLANDTGRLYSFLMRYDAALVDSLKNADSQEERLRLVADAIRDETDAAERGALARAAFGGAGAQLVNTWRTGSAGIDEFTRRAEHHNLVLGEEGARAAERLNDELDTMTRSMQMQWTIAVTDHADEVLKLAQSWQQVKIWALEAAAGVARYFDRVRTWMNGGDGLDAGQGDAMRAIAERVRAGGMTRGELRDQLRDAIGGDNTTRTLQSLGMTGNTPGSRDVLTGSLLEVGSGALDTDFIAELLEDWSHGYDMIEDHATDLAEEIRAARAEVVAAATGEGEDDPVSRAGSGAGSSDSLGGLLDQVAADLEARRETIAAAGRGVFDATRTAAESYRIELERITDLERQGAFADAGGADTAERGRVQALLDMASATDDLGAAYKEVRRLWSEGLISDATLSSAREGLQALQGDAVTLMDDIRDAGDNVLLNAQSEVLAFAESFQSAGDTIRGVLRGIAREALSLSLQRMVFSPLRGFMNSFLDNLSLPGLGGGSSKVIPKFQRGGDFTVGGSGGVDSQLVMFKGTPGESVSVRPSGAAGRRYDGLGGAMAASTVVVKQTLNLDLTGAVVTEDLIAQMNAAAAASYNQAVEDGADLALSKLSKAQRLATR
jgi:hypothetical protein